MDTLSFNCFLDVHFWGFSAQRAFLGDMFTGRLRSEIPLALVSVCVFWSSEVIVPVLALFGLCKGSLLLLFFSDAIVVVVCSLNEDFFK